VWLGPPKSAQRFGALRRALAERRVASCAELACGLLGLIWTNDPKTVVLLRRLDDSQVEVFRLERSRVDGDLTRRVLAVGDPAVLIADGYERCGLTLDVELDLHALNLEAQREVLGRNIPAAHAVEEPVRERLLIGEGRTQKGRAGFDVDHLLWRPTVFEEQMHAVVSAAETADSAFHTGDCRDAEPGATFRKDIDEAVSPSRHPANGLGR
jgi:hypothetical protein